MMSHVVSFISDIPAVASFRNDKSAASFATGSLVR